MQASLIVALLVIAAVWGFYLLPSIFGGRRDAPLNSTEEFDRWTSLMADVQRRQGSARAASARDVIRTRRRRTLVLLGVLAGLTLAMAWWRDSLNWLLVHLAFDVLIAMYLTMLVQLRQRRTWRVSQSHLPARQAARQENQVKVIAN